MKTKNWVDANVIIKAFESQDNNERTRARRLINQGVFVPAPAFAEFRVRAGKATIIQAMKDCTVIEFGVLHTSYYENMDFTRADQKENKSWRKFDNQILSMLIAERADVFYTDDAKLRARCATANINAKSLSDIPLDGIEKQIDAFSDRLVF